MISFVNPGYLLLFILLILWMIYLHRFNLSILLRVISMIFLIFAVSGPVFIFWKQDKSVVWCIDRSPSIPQNEKRDIYHFLKRIYAQPVFFSDTAIYKKYYNLTDLDNDTGKNTKIVPAIKTTEKIDQNRSRNFIIFTDGNVSDRDTFFALINQYRNDGFIFNFFPLGYSVKSEVSAGEARITNGTMVTVPFYASGDIKDAEVYLENESGIKVLNEKVDFVSGYAELKCNIPEPQKPFEIFKVLVVADKDTYRENNCIKFNIEKSKSKKILRLSLRKSSGLIGSLLKDKFDVVEAVTTSEINKYLPMIRHFDLVLLDDVPAYLLTPDQMALIAESVRNYGIGLIMTGLHDSFALGGYVDSPVEKALPVTMEPNRQDKKEDLVILLDKSGSMDEKDQSGITRMQYSLDAIYTILRAKKANERFGITVFDKKAYSVIPVSGEINNIQAEKILSKIEPHGGTDLYGLLAEISNSLRNNGQQKTHYILLTDGQTDQREECLDLSAEIAGKNCSLSVIGIGADKNDSFLENLGKNGKGRTYIIDNLSVLSQVFFREKEIEKGENIVEFPVYPLTNPDGEIFADEKKLPLLNNYTRLSIKESSSAIIKSPSGDPISAVWRYGVGKSAVFASSLEGESVSEWLKSGDYNNIFIPLFEYCSRKINESDAQGFDWTIYTDEGYVKLNFVPDEISIRYPDGRIAKLEFYISGEKCYASFYADVAGMYFFDVKLKNGVHLYKDQMISYSAEYKKLGTNNNFFYLVSMLSGGKVFRNVSELKCFNPETKMEIKLDLFNIFIICSLCLFITELVIRKKMKFNEIYQLWRSQGFVNLFKQKYFDKN